MNKTIIATLSLLIVCCLNSYGQGQVTRPTKQQMQTNKPKKSTPKVTVSEPDGYINGHGYVDLGLPSGLKWATCNVGAKSPEEAGDYFAWGETKPKEKYTKENSITSVNSDKKLQSQGIMNTSMRLTMAADAARVIWQDSWKLPSKADIEELITLCEWEWIDNENKGYKVIGKNGNSIFLPASGYKIGQIVNSDGKNGYYWSSLAEQYDSNANGLQFSNDYYNFSWGSRSNGRPIRPVSK